MEKEHSRNAQPAQEQIPHTLIVAAFGTLLALHLFDFLIFRQDFWGAGALLRLAPVFQSGLGVAAIFVTGLFLTAVFVAMTAKRRWNASLFCGCLLWALILLIHHNFWPVMNAGEMLLVVLLPFVVLDRGRGRGAFAVLFILILVFFEAGSSKTESGNWVQGLAPQWVFAGGNEVRPWFENLLQLRAIEPASIFWKSLGRIIVYGELLVAFIALFSLTGWARKWVRTRRVLVGVFCSAHLLSVVIFDLGIMPFVFIFAWVWSLQAERGWLLDLLPSRNKHSVSSMERQISFLVLALLVLLSVSIGTRYKLWPEATILQPVATGLRFDRNWRLFHGNSKGWGPAFFDLEAAGKSVFMSGTDMSQRLTGSLYSFYPNRDVYFYLWALREAQKSRMDIGFPEVCPEKIASLLPDGGFAKKRIELSLVEWQVGFGRKNPPLRQVRWTGHCVKGF